MTAEYQRYTTAVQAFKDKYFAIPGDMATATSFWGKNNTYCSGNTGTATTPGTCNGDGDGLMGSAPSASTTGEAFQFWSQLALAGLIEGSYTGIAGSGGRFHSIAGTNVPASKIHGGAWTALYWPIYSGDPIIFDGTYGNGLEMGGITTNTDPEALLLKPEEMWNIDTKLDDGLPAQGKVTIRFWSTCTTATASSQTSATYLLSSSTAGCVAIFRQQF